MSLSKTWFSFGLETQGSLEVRQCRVRVVSTELALARVVIIRTSVAVSIDVALDRECLDRHRFSFGARLAKPNSDDWSGSTGCDPRGENCLNLLAVLGFGSEDGVLGPRSDAEVRANGTRVTSSAVVLMRVGTPICSCRGLVVGDFFDVPSLSFKPLNSVNMAPRECCGDVDDWLRECCLEPRDASDEAGVTDRRSARVGIIGTV